MNNAIAGLCLAVFGLIAAACGDVNPTSDPADGGAVDLVHAVPVDVAKSDLTSDRTAVLADTNDFATLRVVARDAHGIALSGRSVVLFATGEGNTLVQPVLRTDETGVAEGTINSSVTGPKIITASIDGVELGQQITVTFTASLAARLVWTIQPNNGIAGVPIAPGPVVEIQDLLGNVVPNAVGPIAITIGSNPAGGVLSGTTYVTAVGGVAHLDDLKIDKAAGGYSLLAAVVGIGASTSTPFDVLAGSSSPVASTVTATPDQGIPADGVQSSVIEVTVRDSQGNPLSGILVSFTATGTNNTLSQPAATTSNGHTIGFLRSTRAELKELSVFAKGIELAQHPTVTFVPAVVSPTSSTVIAQPSAVVADGAQVTMISLTIVDISGNPVPDATVVLDADGSMNSWAQPALTDANGMTTGTLASTVAEAKNITATVNGTVVLVAHPQVTFSPGDVSDAHSTVTAYPEDALADGIASIMISVHVVDEFENPIPFALVMVTANGTNNTIMQPSMTDANGDAVGTIASTDVQTEQVAVTVDGTTVLTEQPTISFHP